MLLFNSRTRTKDIFKPLSSRTVKLYVCGITPYDTTHLGHAFTYITFDVLVRYLTYQGYDVIYTQNVTDIDDDILKKAREENKNWQALGTLWTKKFLHDMETLNILPPTHYVKATESIDTMIRIIKTLEQKKHAYMKKGNVYFRIKSKSDYGKLSRLTPKQMLELSKQRGANPDDPLKESPLDFLLWQKSKKDEPAWESPWGKGRPGWHIECSSMIYDYLGEQIDIHGGGRDLIFPHHESEIAQSESFTDKKPFSKWWMHTAMLIYEGEKMSKSLGNLVMVSELLKEYSPNAIRFVLLSHQYNKPWEFDISELATAELLMHQIAQQMKKYKRVTAEPFHRASITEFNRAMDDDLNTPAVMELLRKLSHKIETKKSEQLTNTLRYLLTTLGFFLD